MQQILSYERVYSIESILHPERVYSVPRWGRLQQFFEDLTGLSDHNALAVMDYYARQIAAFEAPYSQQYAVLKEKTRDADSRLTLFDYEAKMLTHPNTQLFDIYFGCLAKLDATAAGCAVERFRLEHPGQLPETLASLVPVYLEAVPCDPFDGGFLKYEPREAGYVIYTVRDKPQNGSDEEAGNWRYSFWRVD